MKKILTIAAALMLAACGSKTVQMPSDALSLRSPDGKLELRVGLAASGVPAYELLRDGKAVVKPSRLGFKLIGKDNLDKGFSIVDVSRDSFDETWEPVWGEESSIRNHYNELLVHP